MPQCPRCHENLPNTGDARDSKSHILTCTADPKGTAKPMTGGRGSKHGRRGK